MTSQSKQGSTWGGFAHKASTEVEQCGNKDNSDGTFDKFITFVLSKN